MISNVRCIRRQTQQKNIISLCHFQQLQVLRIGKIPVQKEKSRRDFCSLLVANAMNLRNKTRNALTFILPALTFILPSLNSYFFIFLGEISIGHKYNPDANIHTSAVTDSPRSADFILLICYLSVITSIDILV